MQRARTPRTGSATTDRLAQQGPQHLRPGERIGTEEPTPQERCDASKRRRRGGSEERAKKACAKKPQIPQTPEPVIPKSEILDNISQTLQLTHKSAASFRVRIWDSGLLAKP